jgi:hypothetical protein
MLRAVQTIGLTFESNRARQMQVIRAPYFFKVFDAMRTDMNKNYSAQSNGMIFGPANQREKICDW